MIQYLAKRIPQAILLILAISTLLFFLLRLTGDPALLLLGTDASYEELEAARHALGLDRPLAVQYAIFMSKLVQLDFGRSIATGQSAGAMVLARLPVTVQLAFGAVLVSIVIGIPVGIFAALKRGHPLSTVAMTVALLGQSVPGYWSALLLMLIFAVKLRWLPAVGYGEPRNMILPIIALAGLPMARLARISRSAMLDVIGQNYITTARAKGLPERIVIGRHAFKNMLIPVVTVIGLDLAQFLGGAVIIETIFALPGIGRQLYLGAVGRDYPVVQATVFIITIMVVTINIVVDSVYFWLDPRVKS